MASPPREFALSDTRGVECQAFHMYLFNAKSAGPPRGNERMRGPAYLTGTWAPCGGRAVPGLSVTAGRHYTGPVLIRLPAGAHSL